MKGYMYILECSDDSFYTGSTNNLELRLKQHEAGEGANHTKKHSPVKLVYYEEFDRIDLAFYREKQVQGWNRKKKEALIACFWEKLNELAECKNESHYKNKENSAPLYNKALASTPLSLQSLKKQHDNIKSTLAENIEGSKYVSVAERSRSHMIIIITNPTSIKDEARLINNLFDEGLELLHLRKPNYSLNEYQLLINNINKKYHPQLVLNSYHELANKFIIKRLHFSERDRLSKTESDFEQIVNDGFILSTSVHSVEKFNTLSLCFSYSFLSPVFDSISKTDYKAKTFDLTKLNTEQRWLSGAEATLQNQSTKKTKLIALGGITPQNYKTALEMGFDGVAMMGSIWQSENYKDVFLNFK